MHCTEVEREVIKIIIGVVVLGIVVLFHELGHFVAALWCRVEDRKSVV